MYNDEQLVQADEANPLHVKQLTLQVKQLLVWKHVPGGQTVTH